MQNGVNTPHLCDHDAYFRGIFCGKM
ncbi:hypothetical protein OIU78_027213, partial [Salix suchowensis]